MAIDEESTMSGVRSAACCATILALCLFVTEASEAAVQWASIIGGLSADRVLSTQPTSDGGYVLAGHTASYGIGFYDAWCVKLDSKGNVQWQKTYGGPDFELAYDIKETADGGYVFVGTTTSFGASPGEGDFWCVKLDSSGNVQWQRTYGGARAEDATAIAVASGGGYFIAGFTYSFGLGEDDIWCIKIDSSGNILWQRTYGGGEFDYAEAMISTGDGGCIAVGSTSSLGVGGYSDAWCVKLDASGNVQWQKTYGGPNSDHAYTVARTTDGGYVVAGETSSFGAGKTDAWCLKIDSSGNVQWQKAYGGLNYDRAKSTAGTSDGGCVIAGVTFTTVAGDSDTWCRKLDSSGNVQWQKIYGGAFEDGANSVAVASDGGYVLAGYIDFFGVGEVSAYSLRLTSTGDIDPSCGSLVRDSTDVANDSTAVSGVSAGFIVDTAASTGPSTAIALDSTAVTTVICSGGTPGPTITSITSRTEKPGSTATIRGTGFSTDKKKDVVYFGTKKATIKKAKATSISVYIPRVKKGTVNVYVVINGVKSNTFPFQVK